jgi:hypothetical protein
MIPAISLAPAERERNRSSTSSSPLALTERPASRRCWRWNSPIRRYRTASNVQRQRSTLGWREPWAFSSPCCPRSSYVAPVRSTSNDDSSFPPE